MLKDTPKAIEEDFKYASQAFSKTFRQNPLHRPDEKKIPQYMMNLYRAIADDNGRWRKNAKIEGNIVRSIYSEEGKALLQKGIN